MFPNCTCGNKITSHSRTIPGVGGKSEVIRCTSCSLYRWKAPDDYGSNPITEEYKEGGRNYFEPTEQKVKDFEKDIEFIGNKDTASRIANLLNGKARMLDCGCAFGYLLGGVRSIRPDWELYGLEVNPSYAAFARNQGLHIYEGEIENVLPSDLKFDVVVLSEVIEHLEEPAKVLNSIKKILVPGGFLVLTVPNLNSIFDLYILKEKCYLSIPYMHLWFFTTRTLSELIQNNGFNVQKCNTRSFLGTGKRLRSFFSRQLNPILNALNLGSSIFLVAINEDE